MIRHKMQKSNYFEETFAIEILIRSLIGIVICADERGKQLSVEAQLKL